jgi:rhamnogalacturonyl hydrolase YesR
MYYDVEDVHAVHYAEACAGYGALKVAGLLGEHELIEKLKARYKKVIEKNIENTANHVDANVYGILPLEIYLQTGDTLFYSQGIKLADIQWQDPLPNGMTRQTRYWVDDIYMISNLQIQAFKAAKKPVYLERAALEINSYLEKLQQPNGLFYHGESARFFWGRGNGWVAAGLAELLINLPVTNQFYKNIKTGYLKMMDTLKKYQCNDGMWRQLIDNPDSWKETSGTGMFGYSMAAGVENGILPEDKFTQVYKKAWTALTGYISDSGRIKEVCSGTGQSDDVEYYLSRPRVTGDLHGQAPVLWFAHALLNNN